MIVHSGSVSVTSNLRRPTDMPVSFANVRWNAFFVTGSGRASNAMPPRKSLPTAGPSISNPLLGPTRKLTVLVVIIWPLRCQGSLTSPSSS